VARINGTGGQDQQLIAFGLTRAQASHALGADPKQLDAALAGRADATQDTRTRTGLRTDQAAAALSVLTDSARARVRHQRPGRLR
jgi:hypothetical protein